ncbi:MAG: hypothetical protein J0H98_03430 [Solirubrobacterales bacterium]|nr:hypothetical protein [Solirubrobacterales bacterium]
MRRVLAVLLAVASVLAVGVQSSAAEPVDVSVRVEGATSTIFDRVVHTDGRQLQSASDTEPRTCDGTNLDANPEPGPVPTAATADAMEIIGQDFDGQWYTTYDDYFLTRWGPDAEDNGNGWWWGILVNDEYTPVGGCQFRIVDGDEILWVYDAFSGRPMLHLEGPETAIVGEPVSVTVSSDTGPSYEGATVGGLNAAAVPYPAEVVVPGDSDANGVAGVTFNEPGWKRLKARDPGSSGVDDAVASNSIDVCVERVAGDGCTGAAPSRIPARVGEDPAVEVPEPEPTCETDPSLCPPEPEPTCETDPSLCPVQPEGKADLRLVRFNVSPRAVKPGRRVKIAVAVKNAGDAPATRVRLCLRGDRRVRTGACRAIGTLPAGSTRKLQLFAKVRSKAGRGRTVLRVGLGAAGLKGQTKARPFRIMRR